MENSGRKIIKKFGEKISKEKKSGKNRQKIRENLLRYLNLHAKNMYFKGLKLIKCLNFRAKNPESKKWIFFYFSVTYLFNDINTISN